MTNKDILNLLFNRIEKTNNRNNFHSNPNNSFKKNIVFEKKEVEILNKIVEKDIKELDNELKKQSEIIQSFQKTFSDESNININ